LRCAARITALFVDKIVSLTKRVTGLAVRKMGALKPAGQFTVP
jgi:hypothetical protein